MAGSNRSRMTRVALARRRRAAEPTQKPDLPPIAEKADDLEAIKKAVEDAAAVSGGLWLSYLFVLFYIAVAAGAVTHEDLLLERAVKLPFLNDISLPLKAFFFLAPILFVITHAHMLVHFVLLSRKVRRFHKELRKQIDPSEPRDTKAHDLRESLRGQLPTNIFVQFLAGAKENRDGAFGWLLLFIALSTLVVGPIFLLLLLQIQFLPYHDSAITWTHRIALVVDLGVIWWLWLEVLSGFAPDRRSLWRHWWLPTVSALLSLCAAAFSWTVATFPGEWGEENLPSYALVPTKWTHPTKNSLKSLSALSAWFDSTDPKSPHEWIFAGDVDEISRHRKSWFSNTIVLPGFNLYEALKIDDPEKVKWRDYLFSFRGRDLKGAVFDGASLPKIDLEGVNLERASLRDAQLQGASLDRAHLQGARVYYAQLQGTSFDRARLEGANFTGADLQGSSLDFAHLQGARLDFARLQGASLYAADLKGASLHHAKLPGANLHDANLQGASLSEANLEGAMLHAQLQGASLNYAFLQGASFDGAAMSVADVTGVALWRSVFLGTSIDTLKTVFSVKSLQDEAVRIWKHAWLNYERSNFLYDSLRRELQTTLPEGNPRMKALLRIEILDCKRTKVEYFGLDLASCDPKAKRPAWVEEARKKIEAASIDEATYRKALAAYLGDLVCANEGDAIHILRGLLSNGRVKDTGAEAPKLATRIQSKDCPVSAVLTEDDKAMLRAVVKEAMPAPTPAGKK